MKTFHFTLNCEVQAHDKEQAGEIAEHAKQLLQAFQGTILHATFPYKVEVEIDKVEEL